MSLGHGYPAFYPHLLSPTSVFAESRPGIEDVNNELYGGLYSQMIYGESFEAGGGQVGYHTELPKRSSFRLTSSVQNVQEPADESGVSGAHFWEHLPDGEQGVWLGCRSVEAMLGG